MHLRILTKLTHEKLVNEQPVEIASFNYVLNVDGSRRSVQQVFDKDFVGEQNDLDTEIKWETVRIVQMPDKRKVVENGFVN